MIKGFGYRNYTTDWSGQKSLQTIEQNLSLMTRSLPMIFFFAYLNFTVLFFVVGPWPFPVTNWTHLYLFIGLAHLALTIGYFSVIFRQPCTYSNHWNVKHLIVVSTITNIILLAPTSFHRTGSILPNFLQGINDPGQAYELYGGFTQTGIGNSYLIEYVRVSVGPLLELLMPLTIFYWHRINSTVRFLAIFSLGYMAAIFIAKGTNKLIVDYTLLIPWFLLAGHLSGVSKLRWNHKIVYGLVSCVIVILVLNFFIATQSTRKGAVARLGYWPEVGYVDDDNLLIRYLPSSLQVGVNGLHSYMTQGYYGLSLTLKEPFVPMYGLGNSMFVYILIANLTDDDTILYLPYPTRIQKYGWDAYMNWSSIYPWLASDVSFPGTILVVFLIGRLFALSWLDTLEGSNPFAVALFAQFVIMLFYFPANNQVLQTGQGLTGFIGILLLWYMTRRNKEQFSPNPQSSRVIHATKPFVVS